eukprot:scaffold91989_cov34-Phaeocystis_antarctica.AAC.1
MPVVCICNDRGCQKVICLTLTLTLTLTEAARRCDATLILTLTLTLTEAASRCDTYPNPNLDPNRGCQKVRHLPWRHLPYVGAYHGYTCQPLPPRTMATLTMAIRWRCLPWRHLPWPMRTTQVRALANHCLDLAFVRPAPREVRSGADAAPRGQDPNPNPSPNPNPKPHPDQVVLTLRRVAKTEGYSVDDAVLEKLAESCNSDIRQVRVRVRGRVRVRVMR